MKTSEYWIGKLGLLKHPEGGYFREIYRSAEQIDASCLPPRYGGNRAFSTSIYYLLKSGEFSTFHRLKTDEIWHFYAGSPLLLFMINKQGELLELVLGNEPECGEQLQIVIERGNWFAASVIQENSYTLMGCTVAPGFDFTDFEMASRSELIALYPHYHEIISKYTLS